VFYHYDKQVLQLKAKYPYSAWPIPDKDSLVVYIDRACRGNGIPSAKASWGIYFGPGSPYNTYGMVPDSVPQTSTRAETEALNQALRVICEFTDNIIWLDRIKIATDSGFLVDAMSICMDLKVA
jgi:ribonuclease HI